MNGRAGTLGGSDAKLVYAGVEVVLLCGPWPNRCFRKSLPQTFRLLLGMLGRLCNP